MNLLVPHGFEPNYTLGFARGLAANQVRCTVVSDDSIAARLAGAGIPHRNLRSSLDPARPGWKKAVNLVRYYVLLLWTVFQHRRGTLHFIGLLNSRIILFDGLLIPVWFRLWAGRYIHTAHNALPHGRAHSRLFRWVYRRIYRIPHIIIAHTNKIARQLESEFGVDRGRIAIISIGLNEEVPATDLSVAEARQHLSLPPEGPIALFFGKVEHYKGVDVLAEAWGMIRTTNARLVIAGWSPNAAYTRQIRRMIARSVNAARIEWREGFVPNEAVPVWLKACDVVVMPYRHIYQSGVVFLCLRFGVPIVATNVGSLAEFIDKDSGIITESNDPAGIAEAIDSFFARRAQFRREEIAHRAAKYAWDQQCATIKHLYE